MAEIIYKDLSYKINTLGYGHREIVYQKSLSQEFQTKGSKVGLYIPDFVIDNKIIIEVKSLDYMPPKLVNQLTNYLKGTNYHLGILANFGSNKLEIIRRVWGQIRDDS